MNFLKKILAVGVLAVAIGLSRQAAALARNPNDFHFNDFTGTYTLSKDEQGNPIMHVREEMTAVFPQTGVGNRGIERAIPIKYQDRMIFDGRISVTRNGNPENIASSSRVNGKDPLYIFRIGNKKKYLNGPQKYVIEYTMKNVINQVDGYQSLFWNANGTGWSQYFGVVQAKVVLSDSVAKDFSGEIVCYSGSYGSSGGCDNVTTSGDGKQITFSKYEVAPHQNLSFGLKFKDGSFAKYKEPQNANLTRNIITFLPFLPIFGLAIALIFYFIKCRSEKTNKPIIAQYLPPKDLDVFQSSILFAGKNSSISSSIIEMAVQGKLKIIETEVDGLFGKKKKQYKLELIDGQNLSPGQEIVYKSLFFGGLKSEYQIDKAGAAASRMGASISGEMYNKTVNFLRTDFYKPKGSAYFAAGIAIVISIISAISMFAAVNYASSALIDHNPDGSIGFMVVSVVIAIFSGAVMAAHNPLSMRGAEVRDYLKGLRLYIKMAEADRLKFLQSVDGAERIMLEDKAQRVKLYEKLLPYAMIFGLEKSWSKVIENDLGADYRPDWMVGSDLVGIAAFSSAMSDFSSSMNSYSYGSGSSSDGGFGGGGFSGGGGGGGGGGGW